MTGHPIAPTGVTLQTFCSQNSFHSICMGPGEMSGSMTCPYTGGTVYSAAQCPEFSGGGGGGCGTCGSGEEQDDSEATDSSTLEDFGEDSETVESCAANPVTSGHRSVFSLVESALASLSLDMRPVIHKRYGDANGSLGHVYKDPTTGDIHMVIDKKAIDTEVTNWRNAGVPISHWQVFAGTLLHETYHVLDMVRCGCGESDEGHTKRRTRLDYYDTFGVNDYQDPTYQHERDGRPNCLPRS